MRDEYEHDDEQDEYSGAVLDVVVEFTRDTTESEQTDDLERREQTAHVLSQPQSTTCYSTDNIAPSSLYIHVVAETLDMHHHHVMLFNRRSPFYNNRVVLFAMRRVFSGGSCTSGLVSEPLQATWLLRQGPTVSD